LGYGKFITVVIDFLIMTFAVFIMVRIMNKMKRNQPVAPATPTEKKCPECQMIIPIEARRCGHCAQPLS
jgi:large conductance mechanosensitive channel